MYVTKNTLHEINFESLSEEFSIPQDTLESIVNFYRCGIPYRVISERFCIERKTLFHICKQAGLIEERKEKHVAKCENEHKITDEKRVAEVVEWYKSGKSITWIATKLKTKYVLIRQVLEDTGISIGYVREVQNESLRKEIIEAYKNGMTIKQIAEKNEINPVVVSETLRKNGFLIGNNMEEIPKDILDEIIAEYKAGTSMKDICKKFKIRFGRLTEILNEVGVERRKNKSEKVISESMIEAVRKEREAGVSAVEIQRKLKISHGTYYNILRILGLQRKQIRENLFSDKVLIKNIIKYYKSGHSISEVAEKYNIQIGLLHELFQENNVEIKRGNKKKKQYDIEAIVKAYESGMTWKAMSEKFGMSTSWLLIIFKKHGIDKHRTKKRKTPLFGTEEERNKIITLYKSGVSVKKLAQDYETSSATIKRFLKESDVKIRNAAESKLLLSKEEQEERVKKIADAYRNGMALEKIKSTYHANQRTVLKIADENGIPRRKKRRKKE